MADNVVPVTYKNNKRKHFFKKPKKPFSINNNMIKSDSEKNVETESKTNRALEDDVKVNHINDKEISSSGSYKVKSSNKVASADPRSLFDIISSVYDSEKTPNISELSRQLANSTYEKISDDQFTALVNIVKEKDVELRKTRLLSEFIIRNSCYKKDGYDSILFFLEHICNRYLDLKIIESFNYPELSQENNGRRTLDVLIDKVDKAIYRLKENNKKTNSINNNDKKIAFQILHDNLILIAFSLLYYFRRVDTNIILNYLSKLVFDLKKGEIEDFTASHSLGFASSMSASTNKKDFSYLLSYFSKYISNHQAEISEYKKTISELENENRSLREEVEKKKSSINIYQNKISELESEVIINKNELTHNTELAKHQEIHLKDISNKKQSIFLRFLEDEIFNMLLDVQKGLQRSPPKIDTAEYYLEVVIDKIQDKIKCLK